MADKNTDILKSLQSYEVQPPTDHFEKLWLNLQPEQMEEGSPKEAAAFGFLKEYAVTPPELVSLKIFDTIATGNTLSTQKKVIPLKYFSRIAAALLFIVFSVWMANYFSGSKKNNDPIVASSSNEEKHDTMTSATNGKEDVKEQITNGTENNSPSNLVANAAPLKNNKRKKVEKDTVWSNSKGKRTMHLVDDDVILTLVSYKYKDYGPLLAKIKKNRQLKLDHFSYVNVSDKMNDMLKHMYAVKKNHKPTRKARRLQHKLKHWKKTDEKHFDIGTSKHNPIDIIDLSEFVLN